MQTYPRGDGVPIELLRVIADHPEMSMRKLGNESGKGSKAIFDLAHGNKDASTMPHVRERIENTMRDVFKVPEEEIGIIWRKIAKLDATLSPIEYFDLKYEPFALLPDPNFFLDTTQFKKARRYLQDAIHHRGIWVMKGPYGIGKTTFLKRELQRMSEDQKIRPALLSTDLSGLKPSNIKRMIYHRWLGPVAIAEFGGEWGFWHCSGARLQIKIEEYIQRCNAQGVLPVIIIDDAQQLRAAQLEMIRGMLNSQWSESTKLSIILVGQEELWGHISGVIPLRGPSLAPLRDRIRAPFEFASLTEREVPEYIDYRVRTAGGDWKKIFAKDAVSFMVEHIGLLLPRRINYWCTEGMKYAVLTAKKGTDCKVTVDQMRLVRAKAIEAGTATR